jgi:hypothetical protein
MSRAKLHELLRVVQINIYSETIRGNGMGKTFGKKGKHKLILLYKIVNYQAPGNLRNLLPDESTIDTTITLVSLRIF